MAKDNEQKQQDVPVDTQDTDSQCPNAEACEGCGKGQLETDEETMLIIDKLAAERDEYLDALKRERAEFVNFKKRNADRAAQSYQDGVADTLKCMLSTIDNLERALEAAGDTDDALKTGVEMVLRQLTDSLKAMGLSEIEAKGAPFDPNLHHAVMQEDAQEGQQSGMVSEVLQKGYLYKDKVLRYAMVKVIK